MQFIWEQSIWDPQTVNQQELYSIQAVNILPSPVLSVMIKRQATSNLKNMTHYPAPSYKEIN